MQSSRTPLVDPQPGDVIELGPGWERTVKRRVDDSVVFDASYDSDRSEFESPVEVWQCACDVPTARVLRRGEDE